MRMFTKIIVESGCRISMLSSSSSGGKEFCDPYYKISPESNPQHRFLLSSGRFDERGVLEPVVKACGVNLLHDLEPLLVQKVLFFFSTNFTNGFEYWKSANSFDDSTVQMGVELCLYDRRAIRTLKQNCRRAWVAERTMARRMVQEIERLVSGPKKHPKGVRWRPERKRPWVAELKISKNKKQWIGDFDTAQGAAQAYQTFARKFKAGKERRTQPLGFSDDSMLRRMTPIAKTSKQSATYQQLTRSDVAVHGVSTANGLNKRRDDGSDVDVIGVDYDVASSSSWSNSTEAGITKTHGDDIGQRFKELEAPTGTGVATLVHHDLITSQESSAINITDTEDLVDLSFQFAHIPSFQDGRLGLDMCANDFDVQGLSPFFGDLVITTEFHDIVPSTSRKHVDNERTRSAAEGEAFVEGNASGGYGTVEFLESMEEIKSATTQGSGELDPFCEWMKWIGPADSMEFDFETRQDPRKYKH